MKPTPDILFSIVVPTYNRRSLLQEAVQSVVQQTYAHWELLIVDDASTDGTADYVRSLTDLRIHYYHLDKGERSRARNFGMRQAKGDYILFLDDDDYFLSDHLSLFYQACVQAPDRQSIFRTGYFREEKSLRIEVPIYDQGLHGHPLQFAAHHMMGVWSLCIPQAHLQGEFFPDQFPHWQDTHLILRLLAKHPLVQLPNHSYVYRLHDGMGSRQKWDAATLYERAKINVSAIDHFFAHHAPLVSPHLNQKTHAFLINEKWWQYANRALRLGYKGVAKKCRRHTNGFQWNLLKLYLRYWLRQFLGPLMDERSKSS